MRRICTIGYVLFFHLLLFSQIPNIQKPFALIYEAEPNNTRAQANPVAYGDSVIASVSTDTDIDYYSFYANANDTVDILMSPLNGSLMSGRIFVYNSAGTFLSVGFYNNDTLSNRFLMKMTETGTFYVKCSQFNNTATLLNNTSNPNAYGDYSLRIRKFIPSAPGIYMPSANNRNWNSAYINCMVNPNGLPTTAQFEWGLTTAYGNTLTATQGTIPAGIALSTISSSQFYGLDGNTTYHMRVRAENALGVTYSSDFTFTTPAQPDGWAIVNNPFTTAVYGVHTFDKNTAVVVSTGGKISKTTDGGNTWVAQNSGTTQNLNAVTFVNSNIGFAVGESRAALKTTNGGATWSTLTGLGSQNYTFVSVSFVDQNVGYVLGYACLFKTTNGGTTWTQITNSGLGNSFGSRIKTFDASTVFFTTSNTASANIFRSTDGGISWSSKLIPDCIGQMYDIAKLDNGRLIAVGGNNTIVSSTDNGETWTRISEQKSIFLESIGFINSTTGFIVGTSGKIMISTDAGLTWNNLNSGTSNSLWYLSAGNNCSYAVGNNGTVLKTTSMLSLLSPVGGEAWTAGETRNITWMQTDVNNVKLEYSVDNGSSWLPIASSVPAANSLYSWVIPNTPTSKARVKISDVDIFGTFKISNNAFTILAKPPVNEAEPNNTSAQANAVAYGDSVIGSISSTSDVDYFSFSASAGDTIEITSTHRNGSNLYGMLKLYNSNGQSVTSNNYYYEFSNARIIYIIQTSGTYFIRFSNNQNNGVYPNLSPSQDTKNPSATTGDYSIVFRKFTPSAPAFYSINPRYILSNIASLSSQIYTNGSDVTATYEYGLTAAYGNSAASVNNPIIKSMYNSDARLVVSGLSPNTTYHYRIKLENSAGTTYSSDQTFTTPLSTDGWQNLTFLEVGLVSVNVIDKNNIFVTGSATRRTTNGGADWLTVTGIQSQVSQTCFVNSLLGYSVGTNGTITKTTDGGNTWSALTSGVSTNFTSVSFADANNGIAALETNKILKTTDGGATWSQIPISETTGFNKVKMISNLVGYAVKTLVYKTTDGGLTWTALTVPEGTGNLLSIEVIDSNTAYAVTNFPQILKTTNGGASWSSSSFSNIGGLYDVSFMDQNNGIAVSREGAILKTVNAGATWFQQTSGVNGILFACGYKDNMAFVSGIYGLMLKNTNYLTLTSFNNGENRGVGSVNSITWSQSGLANVKIEFSTNNGGNWQTIINSTPAAAGSYQWTIPTMSNSVSCLIRICDAANQNLYSASSKPFSVYNYSVKPVLYSPANNSINQPLVLTLNWMSSQYAEKYTFEISTDSTFASVLVRDTLLTDTIKQVNNLANNTTYFWRVQSRNAYGSSSWSDIWKFKTLPVYKNISGTVTYYNTAASPLKNVTVTVSSIQSGVSLTCVTDSAGKFNFSSLQQGKYLISASKTGGAGGYTAADALIIARYFALGEPLDLLQMCAADANNSGSLNSADALIILQKYSGIITVFPANKQDWVFKESSRAVLKNVTFSLALAGPDTIEIINSDLDVSIKSLCAGDVNKSFIPTNLSKGRAITLLSNQVQKIKNSSAIEIPVKISNVSDLGSFSLEFEYPFEKAVFSGIKMNKKLSDAVVFDKKGKLSISWFNSNPQSAVSSADGEELLTICFKLDEKCKTAGAIGINITSESEITNKNGEKIYPVLTTNSVEIITPDEYSISQNYPNPFNPATTISYAVAEKSNVKILVYNSLGQVVSELVNREQEAGYYDAHFKANGLSSGVYFYSIEAKGSLSGKAFKAVKKMMYLK